jgi:pilus assembly protein TadC
METKELMGIILFILASFCIAMLIVFSLIIRKKIKELDKEVEEFYKEMEKLDSLIIQKEFNGYTTSNTGK